jgi:hypothetical protein
VVGAALLGLDALHAPHQVEDHLRQALLRTLTIRLVPAGPGRP